MKGINLCYVIGSKVAIMQRERVVGGHDKWFGWNSINLCYVIGSKVAIMQRERVVGGHDKWFGWNSKSPICRKLLSQSLENDQNIF
jgi:hypothetical protein